MEKIGYVYLTTNLVNGKQYVGQHLHDDFDVKYKGSGTYIKRAFEKYGWDNFDCKVICWCTTQTQLNEAEDNYIKLLNTMVPNGYNLKGGGGAKGRFTKEALKNLSEAHKGHIHTKEQKKKQAEASEKYWSIEENRIKISETRKKYWSIEENHKKHSECMKRVSENTDWLKKNSESHKKYWESEENRKKQSKAQINHPKKSKKVYQYTKDGEFVKEWCSLNEIQRQLGFLIQGISNCCLGRKKSYKGFKWSLEPLN